MMRAKSCFAIGCQKNDSHNDFFLYQVNAQEQQLDPSQDHIYLVSREALVTRMMIAQIACFAVVTVAIICLRLALADIREANQKAAEAQERLMELEIRYLQLWKAVTPHVNVDAAIAVEDGRVVDLEAGHSVINVV